MENPVYTQQGNAGEQRNADDNMNKLLKDIKITEEHQKKLLHSTTKARKHLFTGIQR
jgi:hypothetical protein